MKKWGILALVVLAGALLIMQYVLERGKPAPFKPRAGANTEAGVSLPPATTAYSASVSGPAEAYAATDDFSGLPALKTATAYKGVCAGASLDEILASHGKAWGYFVKLGSSFSYKESLEMYDLLGKYYGCVSLARSDIGLCNSLPAESNRDGISIPLDRSPAFKCRTTPNKFFFYGYMAGRLTDTAYCLTEVDDWFAENKSRVPAGEFCAAAARGNGPAAALLAGYVPENKAMIRKYLPDSVSDCAGDRECLVNYSRYMALKKGAPGECAAMDRPYCQALVTRADSGCDKLLADVSQAYCAHAKRVKKDTRGYLGMTDEEIKADIARLKLLQEEDARLKKETEKIQADINARVKKTMRKKR